MLLGLGMHDVAKPGMDGFLSANLNLSDGRIFCPAIGMMLTMLLKLFPETPPRSALTAGWISIGNLWMFG